MTTTRREFMLATGAALAASRSFGQASSDGDAERLVAEIAEELLADYPESATSLGIDAGTRVALKSKLQDRSPAGQQAIAQRVARRLEKLTAVDTAALGDAARIDVDVVRTAHEFAQEGFAFPYGDVALLSGTTRMTGREDGEAFKTHYRYIDIYVRRDGKWRIVSVQITRIAE